MMRPISLFGILTAAPPLNKTKSAMSAALPKILGIVNITADSFSDGGRYLDPQAALAHAHKLTADGADIIDLGPASSHPDAAPIGADEEIHRIAPVLPALLAAGVRVSLDSPQVATQRFAIAGGAQYLNDIRGFAHPEFYAELARAECKLIVMHSVQGALKADRSSGDPKNIFETVEAFFAQRIAALAHAGVAAERLILDPGMGFFLGSDAESSLVVLRRLPELKKRFGLPVLISVSRKSFLRKLTGRTLADIGPASLATEVYAAMHGADYIRTHDVRALRDALTLLTALAPSH